MKLSLFAAALLAGAVISLTSGQKSRVLLVPGLFGSQLHADVNRGLFCRTTFFGRHKYSLFWISYERILCLKYLRLIFNPLTKKYSNRARVKVAVKGFGETKAVEHIVKGKEYMKGIVEYFVEKGYKKNVDIRAAPYDWRLDPSNLREGGFFQKVKKLIEKMYNGQGVTIIGHSLGGVNSLYFLNEIVSPQWKKKYIKAFIPVGAPFGGALKALGAILFGSPLETVVSHVSKLSTVGKPLASVIKLPILKNVIPTLLRTLFRTFPSIAFLIPRADIFGNKELVKTSWKSYTAHNYKRLYKAIVDPIGWEMYQPTLAINAGYRNPGVPTYCIYGTGKKTAEQYVYKSYLPWGLPHTIKYGNGDGTVNLESLEVCHRWTKNVDIFEGLGHTSILTSCRSLKRMFAIANA